MRFSGIKIGFALTGSHCTIPEVLPYMQLLRDEGADILPLFSPAVRDTDSRFGRAADLHSQVAAISGREPLLTIAEAEPIGPQKLVDVLLVAPCTGNTMAKLALGVIDTNVTMACKAQLRNNRPVVLAISTNDGLSGNARNLGSLLNRKGMFFVPFGQDAPQTKQTSLVAQMRLIPDTLVAALEGKQIQPILV